MAKPKPRAVALNPQLCDKCMRCVRVCPTRAIEAAGGFVVLDQSRCDGCGKCVEACAPGALVFRRGATVAGPPARAAKAKTPAGAVPLTAAETAGLTPAAPAPKATKAPSPSAPVASEGAVGDESETAAPQATPDGDTTGVAADATPPERPSRMAAKAGPKATAKATAKSATILAPKAAPDGSKASLGVAGAAFSAPWAGWEVALVLLALLGLFAVRMSAWNSDWMTTTVTPGAKPLMRAGVLVLYYALQLALLAGLGFGKGRGFTETFGLRRTDFGRAAGMVIATFVGTRLFQVVFGIATSLMGWRDGAAATSSLTSYFGRDALGFWLTVVMVVMIGPFFEEVVFRGALLNYLLPRTGAGLAVAISSLVFATYHFNAWAFVPVAVMGAAAGWLAVTRRSVWPAYALHAAYNALAVLAAFSLPPQ